MDFSEESRLLIEHWDTFQDALRAYERLEKEEIPELVQWIIDTIESERWSDGWVISHTSNPRFLYANPDWHMEESPVLWVGTMEFQAARLFGSKAPANLCVQVVPEYPELADRLLDEFEKRGLVMGEPDRRRNTYFIILDPVQKCPPGAAERYAEDVHDQVVGFVAHYMTALMDLDDVIQEELGKYRS